MEVKISKETETFVEENDMLVRSYGEGVLYVHYCSGIRHEEERTARLISLLKGDNPSLMVTALTTSVTLVSSMGAIINFEEKCHLM